MNFYIFRHGETFFTKHDLPYYENLAKTADILPEARAPITKMAKYLKKIPTDANFTSPYRRCIQTTKIIEKITGKRFKREKNLRDFYSESFNKMLKRISNFLKKINNQKYQSVAICSHGFPIAILTSLITKGKFTLKELNSYPKPGVLICIENGKIRKINFNLEEKPKIGKHQKIKNQK